MKIAKTILAVLFTTALGALAIFVFVASLGLIFKAVEFLFTNRISLLTMAILAFVGVSFAAGSTIVYCYTHRNEKLFKDELFEDITYNRENKYPDLKVVDLEKKDE